MSNQQSLALPPPTDLTRQNAVPSYLGRSISDASSASQIHHPDDTIRDRLLIYKENLEHERDFVDREIQALIERPPSVNQREEASFLQLRDDLKIRYNNIVLKLRRVMALLEVL